ncbi:FG-GAP-like repeat-containing protein [Paludisphaera mucosa]|uniref:FG-GAP-like repeat-containing protein n=1 Tax=Paludisphaera mucosa TaxID=3030827 RepID=A0ABT6FHE0_9BACT|nr:FG-GAP-like repeat-containing protein [Paludisphaera mucosa]MDG3006975.1 FG-GAP-like repeat-containing protein [Paludisphaera mucosa]
MGFASRRFRPFLPLLGLLAGCGRTPEPSAVPPSKAEAEAETRKADEIPADKLDAVMAAQFRGLGLMEQYEYRKAAEAFREIHRLAPDWSAGAVNLAIALLNDSGVQAAEAKKAGGEQPPSNFDEALGLLQGVLDRKPEDPRALFCKGVVLAQQGRAADAHPLFLKVAEIDPLDAASWLWAANTVTNVEDPNLPVGPAEAPRKVELLNRALAVDPYLASALYPLAFAYRMNGQPDKQREVLKRWQLLDPDRPGAVPGPGDVVETAYGEMGRYGAIASPFPSPKPDGPAPAPAPRFDAVVPLKVNLADGDRWATPADFTGDKAPIGRIRDRFGAAVAPFDADGDGRLDLYLTAAVVGPKGPRDALLVNKGEVGFEDATAAFGLPDDRASAGVAAADFDADRRIDLYLTGLGDRLFRNRDGASFEDLTASLKPEGPPALSLTARWLDLDQDGDLDLYVVNYTTADRAGDAFSTGGVLSVEGAPRDQVEPPPGVANAAYRNDGRPPALPGKPQPAWTPLATADNVSTTAGLSISLVPWTGEEALTGEARRHTGLALADFDGDRDLDLILAADDAAPIAVLNERLGRFRSVPVQGLSAPDSPSSPPRTSSLLSVDLDNDGLPDLVAPAGHHLNAWRNVTKRSPAADLAPTFETFPNPGHWWRSAAAADLDLDGRFDLVGLRPRSLNTGKTEPPVVWLRNEGTRLGAQQAPVLAESAEGLAIVDLAGDPLPDLLIVPAGGPPALATNLGNGNRWLALDLGGRWRVQPELMRTNPHAIGAKVSVQARGIDASYDHTTPVAGLGSAPGPVVIGLKDRPAADVVHVLWPDGVMQAELNVAGDQRLELAERNRKTGSCPVLFTWNGERFVCLGDFLGGGGLGYLVAPGVYGQPDRDESVAIAEDQLKPEQGVYRIAITEPMDEVAYLDHLTLDVVDRPPGVSVALDERFAPAGPRPTGELRAWRTAVEPVRATDLKGRDATESLKYWDRNTVDGLARLAGWVGYAEEHGIVLDFGDRLAGYGPDDRLILALAGWVEYPYSQTNYAAATAGVALATPTIERLGDDGSWRVIEPHAGYPAGLPRMTTLDLTGKLAGRRCVLRIRTNMECYYDQAFVAVRDADAERSLRTTRLEVARASLGARGYTREVSPDGRLPLVYDYDYIDPAPLARMAGKLTRFGDVASLLRADDDRLCVVGPGDEARVEFAADSLPPLPQGWRRSFVLRSVGYCKDADPFTAGSDAVGPLPWRAMPDYPFADPAASRPLDDAYAAYLRAFQTRPAGGPDGHSR